MKIEKSTKSDSPETLLPLEAEKVNAGNNEIAQAYSELERGVYAALETYSNVHRGSGHYSIVTTQLFEQAREIVLEYLGLNKRSYVVIFCTTMSAATLIKLLEPGCYQIVSSADIGLSIGVRALAVKRNALPAGVPFQTGGGTTKLISKAWVIWADAPARFEAGTPAIVNIIAFAKALRMIRQSGENIFEGSPDQKLAATEILYRDELEKYSGRKLLDELRQTHIGRAVRVPTVEGARRFINLDNSASTPTFTPVWDAFRQAWRQPLQVKQEIIREVKSVCAGVLGAPAAGYDVIFTANTTEAINMAAESLSREPHEGAAPVVLNTLLEHSSNELPWRMIPGCSLIRLSVDANGFVDFNELETHLNEYNRERKHGNKQIKIVAISGASNVLGVCNNITEISRIVHQYGARLLVDAAQLVAHRKINMEESRIDYLTFSAHKVYAPFGSGALVARRGLLTFNPAEMELIQSSGEENACGIAALGKALTLLQRIGMDLVRDEEQALTGRALRGMAQIPGLTIYGIKDPESPTFAHKLGVIVFNLKSVMPFRVAKELAVQSGIGVRYGCHCSHIIIKRLLNVSPFLEQFQRLMQTLFPKMKFPGLTRVSLGIENSEEDVDTLISALGKIAGKRSGSVQSGTTNLSKTVVKKQITDFARDMAKRVYS